MKTQKSSKHRKSGQAILFLLMVMVIGLLAVLWNYDLHNIVASKIRVDNAGDAGALSAARWQGITLNMVGEMNLIQAAYICDLFNEYDPADTNDVEEVRAQVEEIVEIRSRIALNGPLMGLLAAQSAAFMNLTEKDRINRESGSANFLRSRGDDFANSGGSYQGVVNEPYDGAWSEYGGLLELIAAQDMVVDCANAEYFVFYDGGHILFNYSFYEAVYGKRWCYFKDWTLRDLIDNYTDYNDWSPLPDLSSQPAVNAEYFGTDLKLWDQSIYWYYHEDGDNHAGRVVDYYSSMTNDFDLDTDTLLEQFKEHVVEDPVFAGADAGNLDYAIGFPFRWHYYRWDSWMKGGSGGSAYWPTADQMPFYDGWKVRDEYNYAGADAAVDCYISTKTITPGMQVDSDWIVWQASAKAFGYLDDPAGSGARRPPFYFGLVFPAFHDVRLIHNAISSRTNAIKKPGYDEHIYAHLPEYLGSGVEAIEDNNCWFCRGLLKWEDESFRAEGSSWLERNQSKIDDGTLCNPPPYEGDPSRGRG